MSECSPRNPCRRVTGPEWTEDQCRWCWRKRYRGVKIPGRFDCQLRGEKIGDVELQVCTSGRTAKFPVFACPLHGRCVKHGTNDEMVLGFIAALKRGDQPELWQCHLCDERATPAPPSNRRPQPEPACRQPAS